MFISFCVLQRFFGLYFEHFKIIWIDLLTKKGKFGRIIFCRSHHLYFTISKESKTRKKNNLFNKNFHKTTFLVQLRLKAFKQAEKCLLCFNVTNMSEVCNKFKLIRQDKHVEAFIRYMLMNYFLYDYHLSLRVFFSFFTWVFLI